MNHVEHTADVLDMLRNLDAKLSTSDKESLGKMSLRGRRFTLAAMLRYNLPIHAAIPLILMGEWHSEPFWGNPCTSTLLKSPKTLLMLPPTLASLYVSGRLELKWPQDMYMDHHKYEKEEVLTEAEGTTSNSSSFPLELLFAESYFTRDALAYINNCRSGVARFIVATALRDAYSMGIVAVDLEWSKKQSEKYNNEVFWMYPCSSSLRMSPKTLTMFKTVVQELVSNSELDLEWPDDFTGGSSYEDIANRALYRLLVVKQCEERIVCNKGHDGVLHILRMLRSADDGVAGKARKIVKLLQCAINTDVPVVIDDNVCNKSPAEIIGYICDSFRCVWGKRCIGTATEIV